MEDNNLNAENGPNTKAGVFPGSQQIHQTHQKPRPNQSPQQPQGRDVVENKKNAETYIKLEIKNDKGQPFGVIEVDLISFREKGEESRYLSVKTIGVDQDQQPTETTIFIDNEEDFSEFKRFITNLNWND